MDKLSEPISKPNWRSLFTNISYAVEPSETLYPVDLNQPFSIWDTVDTLKNTICYVENLQFSELFDKSKVDLYRVDLTLIPKIELRRDYIINIVTGMLYYIDGEPYKGLIYHTPRYGVNRENPEVPTPTPEPSEDDLAIHYLSGFDEQEIMQTVPISQANSVTLEANPYERDDYTFLYWKELAQENGEPKRGEYTGQIYFEQTENVYISQDMWLEAEWTNEPINTLMLDANGGNFDEDQVSEKLTTAYQMPAKDRVEIAKQEGETFGSELLIEPENLDEYKFTGWFTEKRSGTQKFVGNTYQESELSSNTLYAHWDKVPAPTPSANDLTIHYLPGGAESGYTAQSYSQTVPAALTASATLDTCRFNRTAEGYTFLGWRNALQSTASSPYQHGGYYDVANLLIKIFGAGWQGEILDIIESYEDWESEAGGEDDGEGVTDDEPEPTMEEERRAEILDYFSGEETAIQNLFTNSTMSLNGLADWFVANQSYLTRLQEYEENLDEDFDEENIEIDYFDQQTNVNMNGKDMWLEAVWTNKHVITLDANGGIIDEQPRITAEIEIGDEYGDILMDAERQNYVFVGWFTALDGGNQITDDMKFQATDSKTLYAHWVPENDPNVVQIIYNANTGKLFDSEGNEVDTLTVSKVQGTKFGTMPTPEKIGFAFEGWFTSQIGGTQVLASDTVTGSVKLYAHWAESNFVKLDLQGGQLYRNGSYKYHISVYKRWNPYKFYKQMNNGFSGITVSNGTAIGYQARGALICNKKNKGWQLPTGSNLYYYTATGGKAYRGIRKNSIQTKLNGKNYKKKTKFLGWYSKPNAQGNLIVPQDIWDSSKVEDLKNPTLYAAWDEALTITYDANGGYFGKPAKNVTKKQFYNKWEGKKYPKVGRPKRDGYRFLGWYDAPTGGNKIEPNKKTCLMRKESQNIYAHWEKMELTLTISDVKENGWTHRLTSSVNNLSDCTIKYKWSAKPKGTKGAMVHTTRNTTITGRQPGKTFYVWAVVISPYKEKFFSEVKTVTLQYAPMAFNVNVNSIGKTNWTQYCSATIGSLSGYKVAYVIEEVNSSNQTVSTATVNSGTPTSGTAVSGKKEGNQGVKYKVWARATKGTNVVRSTNYVLVQTSHPSHYGSTSSGGDCYKNYTTCSNNTYYYVMGGGGNHANSFVSMSNNNRHCCVCAATCTPGYKALKNGKDETGTIVKVICSICGARAEAVQKAGSTNLNTFVCPNHYSCWVYGSPRWTINGYSYNDWNNCFYTPSPIVTNGWVYGPGNGTGQDHGISHNRIYNLTCSGIVNGSATSVNF